MDEIHQKIEIVLEMLQSDVAWAYQRHKSHTEEKSIDSFVARNAAMEEAKKLIISKISNL